MSSRNRALPSFAATAVWSLAGVLLLAAGAPPLHACDGGAAVPNPGDNPGLVEDCKALLTFRDKVDRNSSLNWSRRLLITSWKGIQVSGSPRRVSKLSLYDDQLQLTGPMPVELGRLTQLQRLELTHNRLMGPIPMELGQLTDLRYLDLSNNLLTGSIPAELGRLTKLEHLYITHNPLTGPIPPDLGQLTKLHTLWLDGNRLTGSIPGELGQLIRLERLDLEKNQLTGEIPGELGQLTQLESMGLNNNQLTGAIPPALAQMNNLRRLYLSYNQLTGSIPAELGQVTNLRTLRLSDNQLTGPIPVELGQLTNMHEIDASNNQLTGSIPGELAQMMKLQYLDLSENHLIWPIPVDLVQRTSLRYLDLSRNQLTGPIPVELGQRTNMQYLDLSYNQLTGPIPAELGRLTQMGHLYLNHNQLTGSIPTELGRLINLRWLFLNSNQLTGSIPAQLAQLAGLWFLHLQHNRLTGAIPSELGRLPQLQEFSFRGNPLTGTLPTSLRRLPDLYVLNLAAHWVGPGQMKLTWDDPGGSAAGYAYRLWDNPRGIWTDWVEIEAPETMVTAGEGVTLEWTLTGLPTNVGYSYIRLRVTNRLGLSHIAQAMVRPPARVSETDEGNQKPGKPRPPTVSAATPYSLTVSWDEPQNTGPAITDYDVRYREGGSGAAFSDAQHEGTARTATLTGLIPDTAYEVQVRAANAAGTGDWSESGEGKTAPLLTGDRIYYFPHLAVGGSWQTTITYINYSSWEVSCRTDFLNSFGGPLKVSFAGLGTVFSRTDILPPGGSVHEETDVDLSAPQVSGWARATCSGPVKAGLLFRRYDSEGMPVAEAGVNATTVPATRFVTFAEQQESNGGTGLAYANPSSTESLVTFTARDAAGQVLASVDETLPPGWYEALVMETLFGLIRFTGSLEVTATAPIVTLSINAEAAPIFSSLPPGELDPSAQGPTTYFFPHLAVGESWQTTITYINYSDEEVSCRTEFISDHGNRLPVSFPGQGTVDNRIDVLPPGGAVHEETDVDLSAPSAAGWARATCSGPVKASLLFRRYDSEGMPMGEAGVNAETEPATRFVTFAEQAQGQPGTGVAYANPSTTAAHVTFTAKDTAGLTLASVVRTLLPEGHVAHVMAELFGFTSFSGSLEVTSTEPIVSLSINSEAAPVFSSLPPGEVEKPAP